MTNGSVAHEKRVSESLRTVYNLYPTNQIRFLKDLVEIIRGPKTGIQGPTPFFIGIYIQGANPA